MSSSAEQLASGFNLSVFSKAEELKKRLLFTVGALIIYRIGTFIPIPGIDIVAYQQLFQQNQGGILGLFNLFAGGAVSRLAIFSLNILPYISASIIMQLMTAVSPNLEKLKNEGEQGRKVINQYTRYLTVLLCCFQGYFIAVNLEAQAGVFEPGMYFRLTTVLTLLGGTMFLVWLGEQITSRGIGNGISLIIFAGIVAELPAAFVSIFELGRQGVISTFMVMFIIVMVFALVLLIVYVERAQRRLPVQYTRRQIMATGANSATASYLPLKINMAGVIPPIFATSLLLLPSTITSFGIGQGDGFVDAVLASLDRGQLLYIISFVSFIIFFSFFYTAIVFNPTEMASNIKRYGGVMPGIRPGEKTAEYIDYVMTRITALGSVYLAFVCVLPEILVSSYSIPFYFGGTSLLIMVSVTLDTVNQIQSHLMAQQYEGLVKKAKMRGNR